MIVKFFKHGSGKNKSSSSVKDYLLDERAEKGQAKVIRGNEPLASQVIDASTANSTYTSGVLSFAQDERELSDDEKQKIMASFEQCLLPNFDPTRYTCYWVEHTDKDRLELNFVFAKTDLATGKNLDVFQFERDKKRLNAWKEIAVQEYNLIDPNDPLLEQELRQGYGGIENKTPYKIKPNNLQETKDWVHEQIKEQIQIGAISDRKDIIKYITLLSDDDDKPYFELVRETKKSLSFKDTTNDSKKNVFRLDGEIYGSNYKIKPSERQTNTDVIQSSRLKRHQDWLNTASERLDNAKREYQELAGYRSKQLAKRFGTAQANCNDDDRPSRAFGREYADNKPTSEQPKQRHGDIGAERTADPSTDTKSNSTDTRNASELHNDIGAERTADSRADKRASTQADSGQGNNPFITADKRASELLHSGHSPTHATRTHPSIRPEFETSAEHSQSNRLQTTAIYPVFHYVFDGDNSTNNNAIMDIGKSSLGFDSPRAKTRYSPCFAYASGGNGIHALDIRTQRELWLNFFRQQRRLNHAEIQPRQNNNARTTGTTGTAPTASHTGTPNTANSRAISTATGSNTATGDHRPNLAKTGTRGRIRLFEHCRTLIERVNSHLARQRNWRKRLLGAIRTGQSIIDTIATTSQRAVEQLSSIKSERERAVGAEQRVEQFINSRDERIRIVDAYNNDSERALQHSDSQSREFSPAIRESNNRLQQGERDLHACRAGTEQASNSLQASQNELGASSKQPQNGYAGLQPSVQAVSRIDRQIGQSRERIRDSQSLPRATSEQLQASNDKLRASDNQLQQCREYVERLERERLEQERQRQNRPRFSP